MLSFDIDTAVHEINNHFISKIHKRICGRDWEIAFFISWFIAKIGTFIATGIPFTLDRIDHIETAVRSRIELHIIKDKKFGFSTKVNGVSDRVEDR
jgi:hypothetical protein